jgi:acyl phosphate:glycerol-3-phosphate acyltransferase
MTTLAWLLGTYLLGGVPFSLLVARWARGIDLRQAGSRNPGATNALRLAGGGPALLGLALDLGKGAAPVYAAVVAGLRPGALGAVALAAVAGHVFSPYLAWQGGKGVATAVGGLGVLFPAAVAGAVALFAAVVAASRVVSLGSVVLVSSIPVLAPLFSRLGWAPPLEPAAWSAALVVAVLVIWRHAGNLRRLRTGSEPRIGESPGIEP